MSVSKPGATEAAGASAKRVEDDLAHLHTADLPIAERERILGDIANKIGRSYSGVDVKIAEQTVHEWGIEPLFNLINTGLKSLPKGKQVFSSKVFSSLYMIVIAAARADMGSESMYEFQQARLRWYLQEVVVPAIRRKTGVELFLELQRRWEDHKLLTEWFRRIFMNLDQAFSTTTSASKSSSTKPPSLTSVALRDFKKHVFDDNKSVIVGQIQERIEAERGGEAIDRALLKSVVELFVVMGICEQKTDFRDRAEVETLTQNATATNAVYESDCEAPLLDHCARFYSQKAREWLADGTDQWCRHAERAFVDEDERVRAYLPLSTQPKIVARLTQAMVEPNLDFILSGLPALLTAARESKEKRVDIGRMYRLGARAAGGSARFAAKLRDHIAQSGETLRADRERRFVAALGGDSGAAAAPAAAADAPAKKAKLPHEDPEFMLPFVRLHQFSVQYWDIVVKECAEDRECVRGFEDAFKSLLNMPLPIEEDDKRVPSILHSFVAYLDIVMKGKEQSKATEKLSEPEIRERWQAALMLYPLIFEKDVFLEHYRAALCKRLLADKSESQDQERDLIARVKTISGAAMTSRLESMINNIMAPIDDKAVIEKVEAARAARDGTPEAVAKFSMQVRMLTQGHWPTFLSIRVPEDSLPQPVQFYAKQYAESFTKAPGNSSKVLTWVWSQGTAEVQAKYATGLPKILTCSTLQMLSLLMVSQSDGGISIQIMADRLRVSVELMRRVLAPLLAFPAFKKMQVLRIVDKPPADKPSMSGITNTDMLEVDLEIPTEDDTVHKERGHVVDAAIVRIMKARKDMLANDLHAEVIAQLRHMFQPEPRLIKKRIEHLIEADYLARHETEVGRLTYLA